MSHINSKFGLGIIMDITKVKNKLTKISGERRFLLFVLLLSVILRLIPAYVTPMVGDLPHYYSVGKTVLNGGSPYSQSKYYPYPPVWMWWEALSVYISQRFNIPFQFFIKIPLVFSDALVVALIYRLANNRKKGSGRLLCLLYALNPVSILITGFHGQFDTLALAFILLSLVFIDNKNRWLSPASLAAATALKVFPALLIPLFISYGCRSWREKLIFIFISLFPAVLIISPFLIHDFGSVYNQLINYSGVANHGWAVPWLLRDSNWSTGVYTISRETGTLIYYSKLLFLGSYVVLCLTFFRQKSPNLIFFISTVFNLFYVIYGEVSSQYLLWIIPFLILVNARWAVEYSIVATAALISFYSVFFPRVLLWYGHEGSLIFYIYLLVEIIYWFFLLILLIWHLSNIRKQRTDFVV